MKEYKRFIQGCILRDTSPKIKFEIFDRVSLERDLNLRYNVVRYKVSSSFDELPSSICEQGSETLIQLEGDIDLFNYYTLNGLEFIRRDSRPCIMSIFLDYLATEVEYKENEIGLWVKVPHSFVTVEEDPLSTEPSYLDRIKEVINENSTFVYVNGDAFELANIIGFNLEGTDTVRTFTDKYPFNNVSEFMVSDVDIIYSFIEECKKRFPSIGFYNLGAEAPNNAKETVFYRSQLSQGRSPRFSTNVKHSDDFGRFFRTTIPLLLEYQSSDVVLWTSRRLDYLVGKFLAGIHDFPVYIKLDSPFFQPGEEPLTELEFTFSTFWDRDSIKGDLLKQDSSDTTGRRTYPLEIQVDLIVVMFEKKEDVVPIEEVIDSIYWRSE